MSLVLVAACDGPTDAADAGGTDAGPMDGAMPMLGVDAGPMPGLDAGDHDGGMDAGFDPGDPSLVVVRYTPGGAGFYDLPWPSDARLTEIGTPDLTDFKGRADSAIDVVLDEIEAQVVGYANMPVGYFALTRPVTEASLPQGTDALLATSPIQLMDLSQDGCGQRFPIEVAFARDGDQFRDDNLLEVGNSLGTVLLPGRPYAFIVLRSFGDAEGRSTPRPPGFETALADSTTADPLAVSLAPLRRCIPTTDLALDDIAVATVFTPQDPVAELRTIRDFVVDPTEVPTYAVADWARSEAWSRRRLDLVTYTGTVQMPMFQDGVTPYTDGGGRFVFDGDGVPVIQRWEDVEIAVTYQTFATEPPGPRPVLVFMDGTGWEPWEHLDDNLIDRALAEGYVVMSFMPQFHGGRAGFTGNTELSSFNLPNPAAGRTNFRQQSVETSYFVRLIRERIAGLSGIPASLDTDHLVYGGHSQGALAGALTGAVEDQFVGYVLNGLSSYLTYTILYREDILDFNSVISALYGFTGELDRWHPLLQMMQLGAESVDPHNFVSRWHGWEGNPDGINAFVTNGQDDHTTTAAAMAHMTLAADMPPIEPPGWDIDPAGVWDEDPVLMPVVGNRTAFSGRPLTLATYLDPTQRHGTIYGRAMARDLAFRFWSTARAGVPELYADREYQCSDGADDDQDGDVDCDDSNCATTSPCVEGSCTNGRDEDGNGLTDCEDPRCANNNACIETDCGDSMDNDGDGATDCDDSNCTNRFPCVEGSCNDGRDGDGDGDIDCADSDCNGNNACRETNCGDGRDNDRDGFWDCDDSECVGNILCPELMCTGGLDENVNGLTDCADPNCYGDAACPTLHETVCEASTDGDGDGAAGCEDADCALDPSCVTTCADGNLGSQTGVALFRGSLMGRPNGYAPADCTSLGSGAGGPDISFSWTAPATGVYTFTTYGSEIDTALTVHPADCNPVEFGCDDNDGPLTSSTINVSISAGQSMVVVIHARNADDVMGNVLLHVYPRP